MKQIFVFLIFLIVCNSYADQTQSRPAPCASKEFRQFDFWVGEWDVYNAKNKLAGKNKIEIILDECVIFENWTGSNGYTGKSFNSYNPAIKKWEQLWVDNQAGVLKMTGEFQNGVLHYTGETPAADGSRVQEDLTFTPLANKEVRQTWKQSTDGGRTWKIAFDGIYKRRK